MPPISLEGILGGIKPFVTGLIAPMLQSHNGLAMQMLQRSIAIAVGVGAPLACLGKPGQRR